MSRKVIQDFILFRWHNHLDPKISKDFWGNTEEKTLLEKHKEYGNKWSEIAKFLPGR